jgi:hypothetical protein
MLRLLQMKIKNLYDVEFFRRLTVTTSSRAIGRLVAREDFVMNITNLSPL